MHSIAYDEVHDEIVVPQPIAQAILTFQGGAHGEEPPIRVIQGPLTKLGYSGDVPDQLAIDSVHNEIFVAQRDHILVFSRLANGNVAPLRVLKGPDALSGASYVAIDPVQNLLVVTGRSAAGAGAVMLFDRTAQGNAKPRAVISGPKAGVGRGWVFVYPPRQEIIMVGSVENADAPGGFWVSVWNIRDTGDVAPRRWMLKGPDGMLTPMGAMGVGVDTKNKTVLVGNKPFNALLTYSFPEIF
jgi:hypothetical protein